uniref:Secreted protein n=1 Tax=Plectus sambesii TaxID=2011161 RepID=A0A914WNW7_9BILA
MHLFALVTAAFALIATTAFGCHVDGKSRKNGEEWTVNDQFVMACVIEASKGWHTTIVACLNAEGKRIKVGSELTEGRTVTSCTALNDGTGSVKLHTSWVGGAAPAVPVQAKIAIDSTAKVTSGNSTAS